MLGSSETGDLFFYPESKTFIYPDDEFVSLRSPFFRMKKLDAKLFGTGEKFQYLGADENKVEDPRRLRGLRNNIFMRFNDFGDSLDNNKLSKDIRFFVDPFFSDYSKVSHSQFEDMQVFFSTTQEFDLTNNSFYMD